MKPAEIFINQHGRLRSGWRFAVFLIALFALLGVLGGLIGVITSYLPIGFSDNSLLAIVIPFALLLTVAVFAGWLCGRFLEGLPFRALGCWFTRNWLKDLVLGLVFGAAAMGFAALITVIFGATSFQFNQAAGQSAILLTLAVSLGIFTVGAAAEEALFRGYILQTFVRANLAWLAIALTSLFFAAGHLTNPSADYIGIINTVLAGIWFSVAYLKTRTLWLAFGLHLAWNWVQGAVLGLPVSGITEITTAPLLLPTNTGSIVLTGGDYGIEGGIACTIAVIIFILLTWFLPIFKPTEEMLDLTGNENPKNNLLPKEAFTD
jgi:membrane protease YdiL (CAAX protease family)